MIHSNGRTILRGVSAFALAVLTAGTAAAQVATEHRGPGGFSWDIHVSYDTVFLTVGGDYQSFHGAYTSDPGYGLVDDDGNSLEDGSYSYTLQMVPYIDEGTRQQLDALRASGDQQTLDAWMASLGLDDPPTFAGSFTVSGGSVILDAPEGPEGDLFTTDVIVQASVCIGVDCANTENFGFDTLRLKENNLRIHFDDTSSSGSFPANDWTLVANETINGGSSYFAIEDRTAGRIPFRVEAGARANALVVEADGDVGIGTLEPVVELHLVRGDTPTLRLDQDNSSGFQPHVWDVAGNETSFFIRDVTSGSTLPFRIRPGAPSDSLTINGTGVGIGILEPAAQLHIKEAGNIDVLMENSSTGDEWAIQNRAGKFRVSKTDSGVAELVLVAGGYMTIGGTLSEGSSREIKDSFSEIDGASVLARLGELPVSEWSYKTNHGVRHLGPMAEDFHRLFGLGSDPQHLAPRDLAAVSIVAIQELQKKVDEKDAAIAALEERLQRLEAAIASADPR